MKRSKYKTTIVTIGLICLMGFCIMAIMAATGLFKTNAVYAKFMGIFIIAAGACLSLNAATTILDKPKEMVSSKYRGLALAIVIATGVLVLLWLIVLFVSDIGLIVKYIGGKKFRASDYDGDYYAALAAANEVKDKVSAHLLITELTVAATIIVAYLNLFVTRRFVFKKRMFTIQVTLFLGAFLFYFWLFWFALSAKVDLKEHITYVGETISTSSYARVYITASLSMIVNPLGVTIAFSGLAMYIISRFASIGPMRRFKNEGLFEDKPTVTVEAPLPEPVQEVKNEEVKPNTDTNDIKARLQKLNELHDQGLINDEDYEKKKKDIIDSI